MGFIPGRVVEVYESDSGSYGSGYLLTDNVVVTAGHLIAGGRVSAVEVRPLRSPKWFPAEEVHQASGWDVAVVILSEPIARGGGVNGSLLVG